MSIQLLHLNQARIPTYRRAAPWAGLGEYASNQIVITNEFGPRIRFFKIFTNLPDAHESPNPKVSVVFVIFELNVLLEWMVKTV